MNHDETIISLKIVGMIKEGQKVSISNGYLKIEPCSHGLYVSIKRWINNDNRHNTMGYIKNLINNAISTKDGLLIQPLMDCLPGLNALCVTYSTDTMVTATVKLLEHKIGTYING